MGGDLPTKAWQAPTFIVWAVKDPDDANLDRFKSSKAGPRAARSSKKSMT